MRISAWVRDRCSLVNLRGCGVQPGSLRRDTARHSPLICVVSRNGGRRPGRVLGRIRGRGFVLRLNGGLLRVSILVV